MKFLGLRALRSLETASVLHPELLSHVISAMTRAVRDSENKRGVGVDKMLRCVSGCVCERECVLGVHQCV